ncbi:MAG: hypothetical protein ACOXZV_13890 [Bacteroidales bacterium]
MIFPDQFFEKFIKDTENRFSHSPYNLHHIERRSGHRCVNHLKRKLFNKVGYKDKGKPANDVRRVYHTGNASHTPEQSFTSPFWGSGALTKQSFFFNKP